jgi:beta-mannosidase
MYREKVGRFNSEYGYQSYPDYATLQEMAQDEPLGKDSKVIAAHQKHPRGTQLIDDFIQRYFPNEQPKDFEEYVHLSQLSQALGMEIAIEAHRTAKPYNMGTLFWQLNDAWPVVSWSSIDYYGRPKELYERLKTMYAPVLLSFDPNDNQVFVTSDLLRKIEGKLKVTVVDAAGNQLFEQELMIDQDTNQNRKYYVEGLRDCLSKVENEKVCLKMELMEGEALVAERCVSFH